ncbi:hypothetical protein EVAR_59524_1 [Eumeta japonica]|uniref:Uncharacterized protein n=1 Tax=Eumeta variegata TaxID=151549 RepID=A0A4C1XX72_EUMVA|nr:hypothetical protein EVAR_59524_1 [Eumeta japonica]
MSLIIRSKFDNAKLEGEKRILLKRRRAKGAPESAPRRRPAAAELSSPTADLIRPIIGFAYSKTSPIDTFDDVRNAPESVERQPAIVTGAGGRGRRERGTRHQRKFVQYLGVLFVVPNK